MSFLIERCALLKIASWNVNSLKVRLPAVLSWLKTHQVDVLALQELKLASEFFPYEAFANIGYHAIVNGQKTYNGVAIVSKTLCTEVIRDNPHLIDPQKRMICANVSGIRLINIYAVNGEALDSDKFFYKERWYQALELFLAEQMQRFEQVLLMGDFNIAPADIDVYDVDIFHDRILCSQQERQWLRRLSALGLKDGVRELMPTDPMFTWWDYRANAFKRNMGLRIDLALMSTTLQKKLQAVWVDRMERARERPSDHAPMLLDFRMKDID